jgi:hypothetical protein
MKYLCILFSITLFAKGCNESSTEKEAMKSAQDDISIQYEASTRGFYQKINLNKQKITVHKDRSGNNIVSKDCSEADWTEIVQLLDKIDSEKLRNNYVNPDDLGRDAVIPALLTISYKENVVKNIEFGHGNVPEVLQPLMTKIEAMVKAVDKP